MSVHIVPPTEGSVTLVLPYDEAEILLRLVGLSNSGSLQEHAPVLFGAVEELVKEFGRSIESEARKYEVSEQRFGQFYIQELVAAD